MNEKYKRYCPMCKTISDFVELPLDRGYWGGEECQNCKWQNIGGENVVYLHNLCPYKETCICGKEHILLTQEDNNPEYHTSVSLICQCGEIVTFNLPVN